MVKVEIWHSAGKWKFSERYGLDLKGKYSSESQKLVNLSSDEANLGESGKHYFL